jgi:hypothetical protein
LWKEFLLTKYLLTLLCSMISLTVRRATLQANSWGKREEYEKEKPAARQMDKEGAETSQGRSEQGVPLLTAQDIKQLQDEDMLGFHRLLPPFRAKRMVCRRLHLLSCQSFPMQLPCHR